MAERVLTAEEIKLATDTDVCVAIKCSECGEDVDDCDCDCDECEGRGYIETFEDCWNYATDSHYTKDYTIECGACGGLGRKPKEKDDE